MLSTNEETDNLNTNQIDTDVEQATPIDHSDDGYSDAVATAGDGETVLDLLHTGQAVAGFPTMKLEWETKKEIGGLLRELCGDLVTGAHYGLGKRSVETKIVQKALLYLPTENGYEYTGNNIIENNIANRLGVITVGDGLSYNGEYLNHHIDPYAYETLASNGIALWLYVPHFFHLNEEIRKHYRKIEREAVEAGVKVKYVLTKIIRRPEGSTKLKTLNSVMSLYHSEQGRDETSARGVAFNFSDIYMKGRLISRRTTENITDTGNTFNSQLAVSMEVCDYSDIQLELHAIKVQDTLKLPMSPSVEAPTELSTDGRLPAFTIPTDKPLTIIRASHGAGKSFNIRNFCDARCAEGHAVIHLLPRQSLVAQARVTYNAITKDEMVDNKAFATVASVSELLFPSDTNGRGNQIAFCVESLEGEKRALNFDLTSISKAINKTGNESKKIYLILDEFPSLLNSILTSETIQRPASTMVAFQKLLTFVRNIGGSVVAVSADMTTTETALLINCLNLRTETKEVDTDKVFCVAPEMRYPQDYKRTITLSTKREATLQRIFEDIEHRDETEGGAILVMLNSLKVENKLSTTNLDVTIREKFPTARVLVLDSGTKKSNREANEFLNASPEKQMRLLCSYDVVLATSIVESGLDWNNQLYPDIPDNFVRAIYILDNGLWGAQNILQASMRVRNQAIPCEVFTPKTARTTRPTLGFYPTVDEAYGYGIKQLDNCYAFSKTADDLRTDGQTYAWRSAFAYSIAYEQTRKHYPRKTFEILAKSNGHGIVLSTDSVSREVATAINNLLRSSQEATIDLRSAVISGAISVEASERIRLNESSLGTERYRSGAWDSASIKERLKELIEANEAMGQTQLDKTKAPAGKAKVRKKISNLGFLTEVQQDEFELLNCMDVYGADASNNLSTVFKDEAKRKKAEALLTQRSETTEWYAPTHLDTEEVKTLLRRKRLTEREAVILQKEKVRATAFLDTDLTAGNSALNSEQWCRYAFSHQPTLMAKRMLMALDQDLLKIYGKLLVSEMPAEVTTGRVETAVGLLKSAEVLCKGDIGGIIKGYERRFLVNETSTTLSFVADCLGLEETSSAIKPLTSKVGFTMDDGYAFLVSAMKQGITEYPRMKLLTADDALMLQVAELLSANKQELAPLIPSVMKTIRKSDGRSNALSFLSQVFQDIGLGAFKKIGEIRKDGKQVSVITLVRKEGLLPKAEGLALFGRMWADMNEKVAKREKFLAITDF